MVVLYNKLHFYFIICYICNYSVSLQQHTKALKYSLKLMNSMEINGRWDKMQFKLTKDRPWVYFNGSRIFMMETC